MQKENLVIAAITAIAIMAFLAFSLEPSKTTTGAVVVSEDKTITIGMSSVQPLNGLLTVAYDRGLL